MSAHPTISTHQPTASSVAHRVIVLLAAIVIATLGLTLTQPGESAAQMAASIMASPNPAPAGSTVTVSGSGYLPGETVDVGYGGAMITTTADANGNISAPMAIDPLMPAGAHPLDASGDMGSWADSSLSIQAQTPPTTTPPTTQPPAPSIPAAVSVSPNPVQAGSQATVSGQGFQPGEAVTIGYAGSQTSGTAAADGSFAITITVDPSVPAMAHPLDANGSSGTSVTISLTAVAAPAPPPTTQPPVTTNPPTPPTTSPAPPPPAPTPTPVPNPPVITNPVQPPAPAPQPPQAPGQNPGQNGGQVPGTQPSSPDTGEATRPEPGNGSDDDQQQADPGDDDRVKDGDSTSTGDASDDAPSAPDEPTDDEITDMTGAFDDDGDDDGSDGDVEVAAAADSGSSNSGGGDRDYLRIVLLALAAGLIAAAVGVVASVRHDQRTPSAGV